MILNEGKIMKDPKSDNLYQTLKRRVFRLENICLKNVASYLAGEFHSKICFLRQSPIISIQP